MSFENGLMRMSGILVWEIATHKVEYGNGGESDPTMSVKGKFLLFIMIPRNSIVILTCSFIVYIHLACTFLGSPQRSFINQE